MNENSEEYSRRDFVRNTAAGIGAMSVMPGISGEVNPKILAKQSQRDAGMDSEGSVVSVVRLVPENAYADIPVHLGRYINTGDGVAWNIIRRKIDYIYDAIDPLMAGLESETGLLQEINRQIEKGKTLFFKINTVVPLAIDPLTHDEGASNTSCTEWGLVAAIFRWFHDKRNISYHQMALGEGGVLQGQFALLYSRMQENGRKITEEAILEGKSGDFYCGWGFYFVRKYLAGAHDPAHTDDPMKGFLESEQGIYVPPGRKDGLYVYALNCIDAAGEIRGREVDVPGGENYKSIMLHKAIIGGEPGNERDERDYPGCVLINIPRLKVHPIELLTNAIKNLGIGLYPTEAGWDKNTKNTDWRYGIPQKYPPTIKYVIHESLHPEIDRKTGVTRTDGAEKYLTHPTGGICATMVDLNLALLGAGVTVVHLVDAIHAINLCHDTNMPGSRIPEGLLIAGSDPVAVDLFCARYMFHRVESGELDAAQKALNTQSEFIQKVPVPVRGGHGIINTPGYDSPLSRYGLFDYAARRGLGSTKYHVIGADLRDGGMLASRSGHFGRIDGEVFTEILTGALYYNSQKFYWDMNTTSRAYLSASAEIHERNIGGVFAKNLGISSGDRVLYNNFGDRGWVSSRIVLIADTLFTACDREFGNLMGPFIFTSRLHKFWRPEYNGEAKAVFEDYLNSIVIHQAYLLSLSPIKKDDPLHPGLVYGGGAWPSFEFAEYTYLTGQLFGDGFPGSVSPSSLYGLAFLYADRKYNGGRWSGRLESQSNPAAVIEYWGAVRDGNPQLPFKIFIPEAFIKLMPGEIPNLFSTDEKDALFSAQFGDGKETWA